MILKLLKHELINLLKSKRVYWTVLMFLLLFVSIFIVRAMDYQKQINQYIEDVRINDEALQNVQNYSFIKPRIIQQPIMFSIFNEGFKFSRVITVQFYEPITHTGRLNEEVNLVYIEDTKLDITFLITFFLSLFILLISYDSVNSEKRVGTLRLLMTYPIKRQSFILKKMLGIFIFVAFTFSLPFLLSIITLIFIYANLLTINFFLSAFFYWFLVMLFILFFCLLGILISACTKNPNRSLVYSLIIWILFAIILPISWDYIFVPRLYNNRLTELDRIYTDKHNQAYRIANIDLPDEVNIQYVGHMHWTGGFYESTVWGDEYTYEQHYRFQRYMYEVFFPVARETELARDDYLRKRIFIENIRNYVFFFNPIVIFNNMAMKITGNSYDDHLLFIQSSREIRDELVNLGVTEEWLFDYRFLALYKEELKLDSLYEDLIAEYGYDNELFWGNWENIWARVVIFMEQGEPFEMELPQFRRYEQPHFTIAFIIPRIFYSLTLIVACIVALWCITWWIFMRYDVR